MTKLLAAILALVFAASAPSSAPPLDVAVSRTGGAWLADFHFPRRAGALVFVRSSLTRVGARPWRTQSWTVETPGVRLERRGHYDVLVAADGGSLPERIRIRFAPFPGDLIADYDPALLFTDGSVALYSEQFDAFPLRSAERAERLPIDLGDTGVDIGPTRVTFRDSSGFVLHRGRRLATLTLEDDDGAYVLFGPAEPVETEALAAIIDPELPEWIRRSLLADTPRILAGYAEALGPAPGARPTLMVSWAGPTPRLTSMGGSVLPGLIAMTYEGAGVLEENEAVRREGLWFIAHEGAHFWLGQAITYQYSRDAWITEGGADLLAMRAAAAVDPGYDSRAALQAAVSDCAALTAGRGVAAAEQRNEHRAYYACGVVFGLVAEAASHRPFDRFVRALVDANRHDKVVTREEWLAALDRSSDDPSLGAGIARLIDRGASDPKAAIASLFTRAGVRFTLAADGTPRLM
jgi:hypothetical protein